MSSTRYLMFFSYIGKPFHGLQRQLKGGTPRLDDPKTVQGRLEMALKLLNPSSDPIIVTSSRTDSGVNALKTACHVDIRPKGDFVYEPNTITVCLNRYFRKEELPIRILKTFAVPEEFHSRHNAIYRTYLYRLAIVKTDSLNYSRFLQFMPIEEMERCRFVCADTFDLEAMKDASKLFLGEHDFRTFMGKGSQDLSKMTRRAVEKVEIRNGRFLNYSPYSWPCNNEEYQYLDVYVQARGFLFRQVRRMVSSLIAVAQGKVSSSDIELMLQVPSHRSWDSKIETVPAYALYLCDVEYSEADKDAFKESLETK